MLENRKEAERLLLWSVVQMDQPLSLARQRTRHAKPRITRYLSPELWFEVKTRIQNMPKETGRERERYARVRWLFTLL